MMNQNLKKAINIVGGQAKLARACGISRQAVNSWVKKGIDKIPAEYAVCIEQATGGQIKRSELRPDLWPDE